MLERIAGIDEQRICIHPAVVAPALPVTPVLIQPHSGVVWKAGLMGLRLGMPQAE